MARDLIYWAMNIERPKELETLGQKLALLQQKFTEENHDNDG